MKDAKMQAVFEQWSTGIEKYERDYDLILSNAFESNGLGNVPVRALAVGSEFGHSEHRCKRYEILWIFHSDDAEKNYPIQFRKAMCSMFILNRIEFIFDDSIVREYEQKVLGAAKNDRNVEFIKEFWMAEQQLRSRTHYIKKVKGSSGVMLALRKKSVP